MGRFLRLPVFYEVVARIKKQASIFREVHTYHVLLKPVLIVQTHLDKHVVHRIYFNDWDGVSLRTLRICDCPIYPRVVLCIGNEILSVVDTSYHWAVLKSFYNGRRRQRNEFRFVVRSEFCVPLHNRILHPVLQRRSEAFPKLSGLFHLRQRFAHKRVVYGFSCEVGQCRERRHDCAGIGIHLRLIIFDSRELLPYSFLHLDASNVFFRFSVSRAIDYDFLFFFHINAWLIRSLVSSIISHISVDI